MELVQEGVQMSASPTPQLSTSDWGLCSTLAQHVCPQVNKIEIQYAKTAKKMDMKKLKQTMWDLLTEAKQKQVPAEVGTIKNAGPLSGCPCHMVTQEPCLSPA